MMKHEAGWREESIAGHACHVFTPARANAHGFVVLYFHGVHLQTLHNQPAFIAALERHELPCIAPMTGPTWWTERISSAFDARFSPIAHVRENVLPWIATEFGSRPPQIGLLGTSMGGQGALRLAYRFPDRFPVVAAISPAIDYHLRLKEGDEFLGEMYGDAESARQDTVILHIHPLNWPRHQFFCCDPADYRWHASAERLRMKLYALGVPHECDLETTGGGHGFAYYNRMADRAIDFLADRLERERLRVP